MPKKPPKPGKGFRPRLSSEDIVRLDGWARKWGVKRSVALAMLLRMFSPPEELPDYGERRP